MNTILKQLSFFLITLFPPSKPITSLGTDELVTEYQQPKHLTFTVIDILESWGSFPTSILNLYAINQLFDNMSVMVSFDSMYFASNWAPFLQRLHIK